MKTLCVQHERRQTIPQAEIKNRGFFATALGALLLFVAVATPALAVNSIWNTSPQTGEWNLGINWDTGMPPVNAGDTARFNTSSITSLFLSGAVTIDSMTFNSGADAFTIGTFGNSFSFVGAGIVNNSTNTQTITNSDGGVTNFLNSSTAGNATIINDSSGSGGLLPNGVTNFKNTSNAGSATITNNGGRFTGDFGGSTTFQDSSSAGNANITNNGAGFTDATGGSTIFQGSSTAANATITNNGGTLPSPTPGGSPSLGGSTTFQNSSNAGNANITNNGTAFFGATGGSTTFQGTSSAANATITNNGGEAIAADGGLTVFQDTSTAGNATITNNGGTVGVGFGGSTTFQGSSTAANATITNNGGTISLAFGGSTTFQDTSNAGNATLIANSGVSFGGTISFEDDSTGGTARVEVFGNGSLDISAHNAPGVIVGSIEGDGNVFLGPNNLTVGSNNLSTVFSGVISDNGGKGNENGSLTKIGTGTLTLTGVNDYTGITTINAGVLSISSDANLGIAPSPAPVANQLTFNGGTLQATSTFALDTNRGITLLSGGGTIGVSAGNTLSYGGVITGAGSFTKTDTGTLVLSGINTYTGGTTINTGTLQLGNGGTSGSIVGDVVDNGTFAIDRSDTFAFGGVISGTGAFQQIGTGTTVLTGTNTYTGGTTISAGTLQLGNGGASGSIVGDVVDNATFAIDRSDTFTFGGVISGTGAFQQIGTGTAVLTGTNTYTGGTTISAGTLQLGNGGASGSIVGDVLNNGTFAINRSDTFTFGGVISGTGAFQQIGTGTTVLTGINTYTGATTVNAGTLLVDGSLAAASAVTVNSGATLGGTGTAAGAVTIADGGILAPGNSPGTPGTFSVGSLSLSNASLLNYDLGTPGVIGSGVNDLTIVTGNLTLDGSLNTTALTGFGPGSYRLFNYGGALTDNTLDIGTVPAGFSTSNFVVITGLPNEVDLLVLAGPPPQSIQFWDGSHTTSNGVIDGGTGNWDNFTTNWTDAAGNNNSSWQNGVAVFAGTAGTVTVTAPIFFAGMEFMTTGYQINQGLEGSLNLIGSPTITTDPNVTATINATLAGDGGITKEGAGTLILNADDTYLGNTTIDAGSLIVDGSVASAETFVNPGGLLGGNGIIGGDVTNSGIVSPGDSPGMLGTLTVNGNYTQNANGTLRIEIAGTAPGQFDLLSVGGHASLAGTLQLVSLNNFKLSVGDNITFLTAQGGVSGTFSTIQNPFVTNTLIEAQINILTNSVQLEGVQGSFTTVACNPNTMAVAKALNSAVGDPRAADLIAFLDTQPLQALCPELELISPEELAAMFNIGVSLANIQSVNLERRMEDIRAGSTGFSARGFSIDSRVPDSTQGLAGPTGPEGKSGPSVMQPTPQNRWGVFVTGLGEFTSVDDTSIAPGYNFSTGGLTFGVDYRVCPNFAIGLTGGYAHTNADLVNNGNLDVNGGTIGAYATGFAGGFYVDSAVFGVFNGYDEHRTALLGTASGETDGRDFNALVSAGYDWKSGGLTIGPLASYQYSYVEFDSFTEHGSLAPLTFSDQNANSNRTALGAKATYDWHAGHMLIRPEIRASWQHEFGDRDYSIVSRFASGAGNSFTVHGPEIGRDSLVIGAGAAVIFNDRVSVYAYYDGELARTNYSSNNVSAGFRVSF